MSRPGGYCRIVATPPPMRMSRLPAARLRPLQRRVDPAGDEVEGRAALHRERRPRVVRQHEDGHVIRRLVAPPALPAVVRPRPAHRAEHVAARGSRRRCPRSPRRAMRVVDAGLAAGLAVHRAPGARLEEPLHQLRAARRRADSRGPARRRRNTRPPRWRSSGRGPSQRAAGRPGLYDAHAFSDEDERIPGACRAAPRLGLARGADGVPTGVSVPVLKLRTIVPSLRTPPPVPCPPICLACVTRSAPAPPAPGTAPPPASRRTRRTTHRCCAP